MTSRLIALPIVVALGLTGLAAPTAAFAATTWTVTSSADSSELGTLRYAIENSAAGDDIQFDPSVTSIAVNSALTITHTLAIDGPGTDALTITRGTADAFNLFSVMPTTGTAGFSLSDLTIVGRSDGNGAGVYLSNNGGTVGQVTVSGVEFRDGHTTSNGAAIRLQSASAASLTISDSLFVGNQAVGGVAGGGAIGLAGGPTTLSISDTEFSNNTTALGGGAVQATSATTGTFDTVLFDGNAAASAGGAAVLAGGTSYTMTDVTASGNTAANDGGAFWLLGTAALTITGGSFSDNTSGTRGGAISASSMGSGLSIIDTTFDRNHAGTDGGAIYSPSLSSTSTIDDSRFVANTAGATGGAVMVSGFSTGTSSLAITGSSFLENSSVTAGGALQFTTVRAGAVLSATDSTFGRNATTQTSTSGSSISVPSLSGALALTHVTVDDPESLTSNAAIHIGSLASPTTQVWVVSSTVVGAGALAIGGATTSTATLTVGHSIMAAADAARPGIALTDVVTSAIANSLVTGTQPPGDTGSADQFGGSLADLQLASLADNGGPTLTRMPAVTSPAFDGGNATYSSAGNDQRGAGHARVIRTVDIGAVEVDDPFFADTVNTASSFYPYTQWMFASGLSTGTAQPTGLPLYNPLSAVSRQAMASFLYRLSGASFVAPVTPSFADVPTSASMYTAIEWMKSEGISTGTPQPSGLPLFKPTDPVSRQAMAQFLARYSGASLSVPTEQSFADVPITATTAAAIEWMKTTGLSTGTAQPSGLPLYKPADPVSRQAMAAFLYRLAHQY